jgi:hypothetical protein
MQYGFLQALQVQICMDKARKTYQQNRFVWHIFFFCFSHLDRGRSVGIFSSSITAVGFVRNRQRVIFTALAADATVASRSASSLLYISAVIFRENPTRIFTHEIRRLLIL